MYQSRAAGDRIDLYAGPYERWVFSPELGRPYAFPAVRRPSTIMAALLEGGGDPDVMADAEVRIPPLWGGPLRQLPAVPFAFRDLTCDGDLSDDSLARRLGTLPTATFRPRVRLNLPVAEASWPATYDPASPAADWRPASQPPVAIVGVIEDAMPFANRAFVNADGQTRISHLWLQSARAKASDRVPFGREIVNGEIDAMRARHGGDERRLYRTEGAIDHDLPELGGVLNRHASHGSHILGLAAGNAATLGAEPMNDRVEIIAVQLPNTVAWDTSGFGKETFMLSALHYIFARAEEVATRYGLPQPLPLVVNFSYGWNAGRHDGASTIELAMDDLISSRQAHQPATAIVLPMGNHFDANMHAQLSAVDFDAGVARIDWDLPPDDRTASYLELWLPQGFDPTGWQVRVVPPAGAALSAGSAIDVTPDPAFSTAGDPRRFVEMEIGGQNVGQLSVDFERGTRWRVLVAMIPTAETGTGRRLPAGQWTIEIDQGAGAPIGAGHVDLWVQRDDDPLPMGSGGRQSRLLGPRVTGYGAMSAIASPSLATRVAGVVGASFEPARYSGAGLVRDSLGNPVSGGVTPDLAAISDQSRLSPGVRSTGCLSGASARVVGTSAAAARATRWMASNAVAGRDLKDGLIEPDPPIASVLSQARVGGGRVP